MTRETIEKYTSELVMELREHEVGGKIIGDAVAQVESHSAESGAEPSAEFGTPQEFAGELARGRTKKIGWPLYVTSAILTLGGGVLLLRGIFGVIQDREILWGIPPLVGIIVGTLAILAWILVMIVAADPIRDPRRRS
ncbi:hypothetical protein AB4Y63_06730 [Leifsonia sp. YAF41]|uniref:hypothetical protein n=1 Tax=Leifsonia sp. YAF41 TaxID=3233086 RepID=UPI003F99DABD